MPHRTQLRHARRPHRASAAPATLAAQTTGGRDRFGGQPGPVRALLEGTAGCSAFLAGLIAREADWLEAALEVAARDGARRHPRRDAGRRIAPPSPTACGSPGAAPRSSSRSPTSAAPGASTG